MANVGIVKSKNLNHEKTPVGGFFSRFFSISVDFSAEAEKVDYDKSFFWRRSQYGDLVEAIWTYEKEESILHTIKISNLNNYSLLRYFFSQRSVHPKFYLHPMLCFCLFGYSAILKVIFILLPAVLLDILYSLSCRHPYQVIVDPTYLYPWHAKEPYIAAYK